MTKELRKKYKFLKDLATLSKPDRRKYMSRISHHNIHIIGEAIYNALNGHCDKHKSKKTCRHLKELRKELLKLGNPKFNVEKKTKNISSSAEWGWCVFYHCYDCSTLPSEFDQ